METFWFVFDLQWTGGRVQGGISSFMVPGGRTAELDQRHRASQCFLEQGKASVESVGEGRVCVCVPQVPGPTTTWRRAGTRSGWSAPCSRRCCSTSRTAAPASSGSAARQTCKHCPSCPGNLPQLPREPGSTSLGGLWSSLLQWKVALPVSFTSTNPSGPNLAGILWLSLHQTQ